MVNSKVMQRDDAASEYTHTPEEAVLSGPERRGPKNRATGAIKSLVAG
jgi:hypothetical protein